MSANVVLLVLLVLAPLETSSRSLTEDLAARSIPACRDHQVVLQDEEEDGSILVTFAGGGGGGGGRRRIHFILDVGNSSSEGIAFPRCFGACCIICEIDLLF